MVTENGTRLRRNLIVPWLWRIIGWDTLETLYEKTVIELIYLGNLSPIEPDRKPSFR